MYNHENSKNERLVSEAQAKDKIISDHVEAQEPTTPKFVSGVVTDCGRLNVREQPSLTADIVCEIPKFTRVVVDEALSTDDFYKVSIAPGVGGFCLKKYIELEL